ncbi:MAG: tetratricopeptide repeat protein [Melioribacteraceae bacterium]|nr:tetratricopeptide repeat protein [Melioribacteraceae bacterium]MCF8355507.1 tetratricopeptide repeat protein [Melioribacteraceae bacterium]MCF8394195.1 tetratricopeptide repeat protein [Melioribacteraceae bacterium]MCF8419915.1 tetratricopeptide repeat protein [Melioribacteraceae bacterium]
MKYILLLTYILLLAGCSADIQKSDKDKSPKTVSPDSSNLKMIAQEKFIDGTMMEMKGDYAQAILEYQDALNLDPSAGIYFALAKNYLRLNKIPPAIKNARMAVKLDPEVTDYQALLGQIYTMTHMYDEAIDVYNKIIEKDSTNRAAYFTLGQIYEIDKPIQALNIYKKLLDITGPQWDVLVKIADLNERMGNVDETINTMENLLEINPSNIELQKVLIEAYIKTKKLERAEELVYDGMILFPDDLNLIEFKASIHAQREEWDAAIEEYNKLIDAHDLPFQNKMRLISAFITHSKQDTLLLPAAKEMLYKLDSDSTDWQLKIYLGEVELQDGNDSIAIDYFKQGAELAEWNPQIWIRLGGLLFDSGNYDEAIEQMSTAVERFPDEYVINIVLGLSYSQKGRHKSALPYLEKSLSLNPNDITSLSAVGFTLNQLKREDEAMEYLERAVRLDPGNSQVWGMLGMIYDNKKMWKQCDDAYTKALELDPDDALLLNNYAYSLVERDTLYNEALEMAKKAIESDPESPSYLDTIGWIYYKLGDYNTALDYVKKSVDKDESAVVIDHLGDIYFKLGKKDEALEQWKKAYELDDSMEEVKEKIETGEL